MGLEDFKVPDKIQLVMIWQAVMWMISCTRTLCASRGQRELVRRRLEPQCELG